MCAVFIRTEFRESMDVLQLHCAPAQVQESGVKRLPVAMFARVQVECPTESEVFRV